MCDLRQHTMERPNSSNKQRLCVPRSIGGANYRSFLALLVAALALVGLQAAVSALQLAASWHAAQRAHWPAGVHGVLTDGELGAGLLLLMAGWARQLASC